MREQFQQYYFGMREQGMGRISSMFEVERNALSAVIGNEQHIEVVMEAIDRFIIRPYEDFKNWLLNIVKSRDIAEKLMDLLFAEVFVYSFDSFKRNIRTKGRLQSIIGLHGADYVARIWGKMEDSEVEL